MQALAASLAPLRHASGSGLMPSGSLPDGLGSGGSDAGADAAVPDAQEAHYLGELRKFIKEKGVIPSACLDPNLQPDPDYTLDPDSVPGRAVKPHQREG